MAVVSTVSTPAGGSPRGCATDGTNIWVCNFLAATPSITLYAAANIAAGAVATITSHVVRPLSIAIGTPASTRYAWVVDNNDSLIIQYNAATQAYVASSAVISTGNVATIYYDAGTKTLWCAITTGTNANTVAKLDATVSPPTVIGYYATGTLPQGITGDGTNIYIVNNGSSNVTVLTAATGAANANSPVSIPGSATPFTCSYDGIGTVYADNYPNSALTTINTTTITGSQVTTSVAFRAVVCGHFGWVWGSVNNATQGTMRLSPTGTVLSSNVIGAAVLAGCYDPTTMTVFFTQPSVPSLTGLTVTDAALSGEADAVAAGTLTLSGTSAGAGLLAGALTLSGTPAGAGLLAGALTIVDVEAGMIVGNGQVMGAAAVGDSLSGTMAAAGVLVGALAVGDVLTGADATGATAPAVCSDDLSGTPSGSGLLSGALTIVDVEAGAIVGNGQVMGALAASDALSGTMTGAGTSAGAAVASDALSGTMAGAGVLAGTATVTDVLTGTLPTNAPMAGALAVGDVLTGTGATLVSIAGAAAVGDVLSGTPSGLGLASGAATSTVTATATAAGTGFLSGLASAAAALLGVFPIAVQGLATWAVNLLARIRGIPAPRILGSARAISAPSLQSRPLSPPDLRSRPL
jgi:hypothetical protein